MVSRKNSAVSIGNKVTVSYHGYDITQRKKQQLRRRYCEFRRADLGLQHCYRNTAKGTDITPGQGGGICNYGVAVVSTSTVSNNTATEAGGIFNLGTVYLWRSTLSGNSTGSFGGGADSSTISANSSPVGAAGGIDNSSQEGNTVTLANTILAGNANSDCNGDIASQNYNLIGTTSGCAFAAAPHDLVNVSAGIGSLASNGGPTQTMALLPGSPAINAGNPQGCRAPNGAIIPVDQRGFPRTRPADPVCDIGAYELAQ